MAVARDANGGSKTSNAAQITWTHANAGNLMIIGVGVPTTVTVDSVKFNAVDFTQYITIANSTFVRSEIWYLVNPTAGSHTAEVNVSVATSMGAGSQSFTGADTSTPLARSATATGASTTPTVNIATDNSDQMVLDCVGEAIGANPHNVGANQTLSWDQIVAGAGQRGSFGSTEPGNAGTVTMSWSIAAARFWATAAVVINAAAGGPATNPKGPLGMPLHGPLFGPVGP